MKAFERCGKAIRKATYTFYVFLRCGVRSEEPEDTDRLRVSAVFDSLWIPKIVRGRLGGSFTRYLTSLGSYSVRLHLHQSFGGGWYGYIAWKLHTFKNCMGMQVEIFFL